jgi:uncharacterized membrane protein YphA (DoxX/SURF4 family)
VKPADNLDIVFLFVSRTILAAVFLSAGALKLKEISGFRASLSSWGLTGPLAAIVAWVIPVLELIFSVSILCSGILAKFGAVGLCGLASSFAIAIGYNMKRGFRPNCHCFGNASASPISANHLCFAVAAGLAAFLVAAANRDRMEPILWPLSSTSGFPILFVAILVAVVVLRIKRDSETKKLLEYLLESVAELRGLPLGAQAPKGQLKSTTGQLVDLDSFHERGRPAAFIFVHPKCGLCKALFATLVAKYPTADCSVNIVLLSSGSASETRSAYSGEFVVLLDSNDIVKKAFGSDRTPSAVLVDSSGQIASALAVGPRAIRALISSEVAKLDAARNAIVPPPTERTVTE